MHINPENKGPCIANSSDHLFENTKNVNLYIITCRSNAGEIPKWSSKTILQRESRSTTRMKISQAYLARPRSCCIFVLWLGKAIKDALSTGTNYKLSEFERNPHVQ